MRTIKELSRDDAAAAGSTRGRLGSDREEPAFVAHCRFKMLAVQIWVLAPG